MHSGLGVHPYLVDDSLINRMISSEESRTKAEVMCKIGDTMVIIMAIDYNCDILGNCTWSRNIKASGSACQAIL